MSYGAQSFPKILHETSLLVLDKTKEVVCIKLCKYISKTRPFKTQCYVN